MGTVKESELGESRILATRVETDSYLLRSEMLLMVGDRTHSGTEESRRNCESSIMAS
jgi:hypothetical protein